MSKNNGSRLGPRNRSHRPMKTDTRIVYGATCTWWGKIQDAHTPNKIAHYRDLEAQVANRQRPELDIPLCPSCYGNLLQVPDIDAFWRAVGWFERGEHGVARKHPGYTDFMRWMERRCFRDIYLATVAYKSQTGVDIVLDPADFALPKRPQCTCVEGRMDLCGFCLAELSKHNDRAEQHAEICESED